VTGNSSGCCVVQDAHGVSEKDKHGVNRSLSDLKFLQKRKFGFFGPIHAIPKNRNFLEVLRIFFYGSMNIAFPEGNIFENRTRKNGHVGKGMKSH